METRLLELLKKKKWHVATAESCTGGLIGAALTSTPGISEVYAGGVISYANQVKIEVLHVPNSVLSTVGAVSEDCAKFMVRGAAELCHAECAVSTTGIAGPDGGNPEKPVGTVCIGIFCKGKIFTETNHFTGSREEIRQQAVRRALDWLCGILETPEV